MTVVHDTKQSPPKDPSRKVVKRRQRGRPRLEQVADIERELVEVALTEFLKNGYADTSMGMIVKAAGISKTTLYSRFSSKKELFVAMMQEMAEGDLSTQIRADPSPSRSLEDMLCELAFRSLEIGLDPVHSGVIRLIYGESHRLPELRAAGEILARTTMSSILNVMTGYAEREGLVFRDPSVPARLLMLMLRGCHLDVLQSGDMVLDDERRGEISYFIRLLAASKDEW
ncbi:MAG: TetR/AcrR family transcriptional regulator [Sphingomonadaceae bacterium]|nr:TetR/AcrR family transcriptional regulator [Sphingomonadaceae bacterium]